MPGMKPYYINGIGIISPQRTFDNAEFLSEVISYDKNVLTSVTPDFKAFINPIQLRRLSRMLRIGMTAATICLRDAKIQAPDGIITATGYGFLEETEKFLREMLDRQEKQLTPTYFMQGTYNALAGLIALSTKCSGYNNTYVSKGFAFENALEDAIMQLADNGSQNLLVGSYDEAAAVQHVSGLREMHYKSEYINSADLFESTTTGSLQGEGSAFFNLSGTPADSTWCVLSGLQIVYSPENEMKLSSALHSFLAGNEISIKEIDIWINGTSGDVERDKLVNGIERTVFGQTAQARFKHLCGEYCTATSFALWLGASILKKQVVPETVNFSRSLQAELKTILIVNHYMNKNYSFILLKKF